MPLAVSPNEDQSMNKDELLDLADYITNSYGEFIQIKYFVYLPSENEYYLIAGFPDDDDERIHSRAE
jgi:hypothetical protein